jgi:hypothetical protein
LHKSNKNDVGSSRIPLLVSGSLPTTLLNDRNMIPPNSLVIPTIMGLRPSRHLGRIIHPPQHELVIKIELLHLAVARHVVWKGNLQHAPDLPILVMRLQLPSLETRHGEAEKAQ